MKSIFKFLIIAILLSSCQDSAQEKLDNMIEQFLKKESNITKVEFEKLVDFTISHRLDLQSRYPVLFRNGKLDLVGLTEIITKNPQYHKLTIKNGNSPEIFDSNLLTETRKKTTIIPKLYLERSGSMVFYDRPKGQGQFKATLVKILNDFSLLKPEKSLVYIVNNEVYPFDRSFAEFIRLSDIFAATKSIGDPNYTDFDKIYRTILENTEDNHLSIFVSDLIYSTSDMSNKNNERIAREIEGITTNIFNNYADEYSFLILKLNSDYIGDYYPYSHDPENKIIEEFTYHGTRPYYICFIAKNATLTELLESDIYKDVRNFQKLEEFENFYYFTKSDLYKTPNYSILLYDSDNEGFFKQEKEEFKQQKYNITALQDIDLDKVTKRIAINIAVDLSHLFIDGEYIKDPKNYSLNSKDKFEIVSIQEFKKAGFTHKVTISTTNLKYAEQKLQITLKKTFPRWISNSSTIDDTNGNVTNFKETTFGLENMMKGIYYAYKTENENYFQIAIQLKK